MKQLVLLTILTIGLVACSSDDDLATINGETITKQQFNDYLAFKRIQVRDEKHRAALVDQFLERMALSKVISEQKSFDKAAADAELEEFRRQMNISRYFENYLQTSVTEQQVQNYYVTNEDRFAQEKVKVSHVLIRLNRGAPEDERKAKLTQINEAYSKLKMGVEFSKIVDDYSEDRVSAKNAGDLGWLKKGAIDARFSDTIFSMKKDEISEPFETSFGFHIVKITEEPAVVKKPFEAVKGDIFYQIKQQAKDAEMKRLIEKISIKKTDS